MTLVEVQFNNLTVTVPNATDAKAAYTNLCNALDAAGFEWTSDTYQVHSRTAGEQSEERSTEELFPKE